MSITVLEAPDVDSLITLPLDVSTWPTPSYIDTCPPVNFPSNKVFNPATDPRSEYKYFWDTSSAEHYLILAWPFANGGVLKIRYDVSRRDFFGYCCGLNSLYSTYYLGQTENNTLAEIGEIYFGFCFDVRARREVTIPWDQCKHNAVLVGRAPSEYQDLPLSDAIGKMKAWGSALTGVSQDAYYSDAQVSSWRLLDSKGILWERPYVRGGPILHSLRPKKLDGGCWDATNPYPDPVPDLEVPGPSGLPEYAPIYPGPGWPAPPSPPPPSIPFEAPPLKEDKGYFGSYYGWDYWSCYDFIPDFEKDPSGSTGKTVSWICPRTGDYDIVCIGGAGGSGGGGSLKSAGTFTVWTDVGVMTLCSGRIYHTKDVRVNTMTATPGGAAGSGAGDGAKVVRLTYGQTYTVVVGSGGEGGAGCSDGSAGEASSAAGVSSSSGGFPSVGPGGRFNYMSANMPKGVRTDSGCPDLTAFKKCLDDSLCRECSSGSSGCSEQGYIYDNDNAAIIARAAQCGESGCGCKGAKGAAGYVRICVRRTFPELDPYIDWVAEQAAGRGPDDPHIINPAGHSRPSDM